MMYCTPEARALCPTGHLCESRPSFTDDSECAKFNALVAAGRSPVSSRFEQIRQMSLEDMAELLMALDDCERIRYCTGSCGYNGIPVNEITHEMCKACMVHYLKAEGPILREVG